MITLDQIRTLEKKVHAAVSRIANLKHENSVLKEKLESYEQRITELEARISDFKQEQSEIEQGILSALDQLDQLEDDVLDPSSASEASDPASTPAAGPDGISTGEPESAHVPPAEERAGNESFPGDGDEAADADDAATEEPAGDDIERSSEERGELDIF